MNFVGVEARNLSSEPRTGFVSSAYRFSAPSSDFRGASDYRQPEIGALPRRFTDGQVQFDPAWKYAVAGDSLQRRNGRVLYLFSNEPEPIRSRFR